MLQAAGWTKVGKHSKAETSKGTVPDEGKEQRQQASPSSADRADDQNLKKAIKVCSGAWHTGFSQQSSECMQEGAVQQVALWLNPRYSRAYSWHAATPVLR